MVDKASGWLLPTAVATVDGGGGTGTGFCWKNDGIFFVEVLVHLCSCLLPW